jgi:Zn-dependent M28 family amino/carboxypeptidase
MKRGTCVESGSDRWMLTEQERGLAARLDRHVRVLAGDIGERNYKKYRELCQAADWIEEVLSTLGFSPWRQEYSIMNRHYFNISVEVPGLDKDGEIVQVGAHYDSVAGSPGADDNGSAVAILLELAGLNEGRRPGRTLRFTFFTNEESPFSFTRDMGSQVFARSCRKRGEKIRAMLSLEMLGFYSDRPGSQKIPAPLRPFYPDRGNFVAFVGNVRSAGLVRRCLASFRAWGRFPCQGAAVPAIIPGVSWSDHWSFWRNGYRAAMVTDTAFYRNPYYHTKHDLPDTLKPDRMALVVLGLDDVISDLADTSNG